MHVLQVHEIGEISVSAKFDDKKDWLPQRCDGTVKYKNDIYRNYDPKTIFIAVLLKLYLEI